MRIAALAIAGSLLLGCPGPQVVDPVPDLKDAQSKLKSGKLAEGFEVLSGLLASISARADWQGHLGRARILAVCFEAGAVEFLPKVAEQSRARFKDLAEFAVDRATLSTATAEAWVGVLAGSSTSETQREAARGLATCLRQKLADPALRRVTKECCQTPAGDKMYRRLMLETIVECERYLLGRMPPGKAREPAGLVEALGELAGAYDGLETLANLDPDVAKAWKAAAEQCRAEATTVQRDPVAVEAKPATRRLVEADARTQAEDASSYGEKAIQEITRRSSHDRIIAQVEESLRRFLLIVETQTGREFPVTSIVVPVDINRGHWKTNAFKRG